MICRKGAPGQTAGVTGGPDLQTRAPRGALTGTDRPAMVRPVSIVLGVPRAMAELLRTYGGTEFANVTLGAPDLALGVAWLADLTGVKPVVVPPWPDDWALSAALPLVHGGVVEILAPNPDHKGFVPMKPRLAALTLPELVLWHIETTDFEWFADIVSAVDTPIERAREVNDENEWGRRRGRVGILGPGFRGPRPCVAHWTDNTYRQNLGEPVCTATRFAVTDREAPPLNRLFDAIGLRLRAQPGPPSMMLDLDTPRGPVRLEGGRITHDGVGALLLDGYFRLRHLVRSGR